MKTAILLALLLGSIGCDDGTPIDEPQRACLPLTVGTTIGASEASGPVLVGNPLCAKVCAPASGTEPDCFYQDGSIANSCSDCR